MKHVIHTPTEQFGFVETEFGNEETGAAFINHRELVWASKPGCGLTAKEFNDILDEYLTSNKIAGDPGIMARMNTEQCAIIQAIKRSKKRTNK